jgi:hypothetical protein
MNVPVPEYTKNNPCLGCVQTFYGWMEQAASYPILYLFADARYSNYSFL